MEIVEWNRVLPPALMFGAISPEKKYHPTLSYPGPIPPLRTGPVQSKMPSPSPLLKNYEMFQDQQSGTLNQAQGPAHMLLAHDIALPHLWDAQLTHQDAILFYCKQSPACLPPYG